MNIYVYIDAYGLTTGPMLMGTLKAENNKRQTDILFSSR
jgi:hypothetical protein